MSGSTVLIVDDERTLARAIKAFLTESGYEAEVAGDAEQALRLLETMRPDVVFTDVRLPGMDGIELLRRIREFDAAIPVIIMTAHGTIEGAVEAVKLGAFDYLKKPDRPRGAQAPGRPRPGALPAPPGTLLLPPARRGARDAACRRHRRVAVHPGGAGPGAPDRGAR